jgi:hypothetical protein
MFFYVFLVFNTQSILLMLQYHISTTKHSTVPVFIPYVLLCACCILHTITCTNVTISHINNQKVYCSRTYTVYHFVFVVFCTQSLVLMLQYYILTTKHAPGPLLIRMFFYLIVVFYTQSLVLILKYHISTTKHSTVPLFIRYVLLCVCCILHTITCPNVTISHINSQTVYR